jgi:hypothetical protein
MRFQILSADVFTSNVGTSEQLETLKLEALQQRKLSLDEFCFSNDKCWRSSFKYKNIDYVIAEIQKLVSEAINYYMNLDPLYEDKVKHYGNPTIKYWTNVNEPTSKNALHNHALHHFVAVYYIQSENTGQLVFHNPANLVQECHPHGAFVSMSAFNPKPGDLYVWPGWVPHETETNLSNTQRINIAFNITFETPMMVNHEKN